MFTRQNQTVAKALRYTEKKGKALRIRSKRIIKKVQIDRKHIIAELQDAEDECLELQADLMQVIAARQGAEDACLKLKKHNRSLKKHNSSLKKHNTELMIEKHNTELMIENMIGACLAILMMTTFFNL